MAALPPDHAERQPYVPTTSPASAFLWLGLTCLLLAAAAGAGAVLLSLGANALASTGWLMAVCLLAVGFLLLIAHARHPVWQQVANLNSPFSTGTTIKPGSRVSELGERQTDLWIAVTLAVVAVVPRAMTLTHSLWFDELWTLSFLRSGPLYALTHQAGYNNHLLNSLLGSLCLQVYGFVRGVDVAQTLPPAWVVRLPAFLFGVGAVPLLYAAVRAHCERPVAMAAAALLALSPAAVDYAGQSRGYTAMIFFAIAQALTLTRALRKGQPPDWVAWLLSAFLGTLAHLYFTLVVLTMGLLLLIQSLYHTLYWRDRRRARVAVEQAALMPLAWLLLVGAGYAGVWAMMRDTLQRQSATPPNALAHEVLLPTLQLWGGVPRDGWLGIFLVASLALSVLGVWYLLDRSLGAAVMLPLLLIAPPLIVELASPHDVYPRFFVFALPAFLTLIACGLWQTTRLTLGPKQEDSLWKEPLFFLLFVGFFLLTVPGLREIMRLPKQDYARAAQSAQARRGNTPVAAVGLGSPYLKLYAPNILLPKDVADLRRMAQGRSLLVLDTNLVSYPDMKFPPAVSFLREKGGTPVETFPGRLSDWPYHWLDGDSDILLYSLPPSP